MTSALLLVTGLVALVAGAEFFVRAAATLATRFGVSALVVGLTIVAFGTSAPELAVSLSAVADDTPDLSVGAAVGSNVFNVLFILGLTALIRPLIVHQKLVRIDVPIMILAAGLLWFLARDGALSRAEGLLLFAGVVVYTFLAILMSRRESAAIRAEYDESNAAPPNRPLLLTLGMLAVGLVAIVLGARWLVEGASRIAASLGVSDLIVGLTVVAAGTSLPELATSVVAAIRGHRDIAVGNVVGSNIFNVLCIIGATSALSSKPLPVPPSVLAFDLPVMFAVCVACLPVFFGGAVTRLEGAILFVAYIAYTGYLVLDSSGHEELANLSAITLWFVLPLSALGLVGAASGWRRRQRSTIDA